MLANPINFSGFKAKMAIGTGVALGTSTLAGVSRAALSGLSEVQAAGPDEFIGLAAGLALGTFASTVGLSNIWDVEKKPFGKPTDLWKQYRDSEISFGEFVKMRAGNFVKESALGYGAFAMAGYGMFLAASSGMGTLLPGIKADITSAEWQWYLPLAIGGLAAVGQIGIAHFLDQNRSVSKMQQA